MYVFRSSRTLEELRQAHKARVAVAWAALDPALQAFYDNKHWQKQVVINDNTRAARSQDEAERHSRRFEKMDRDHRKITMDTAIPLLDSNLNAFGMEIKLNVAGGF